MLAFNCMPVARLSGSECEGEEKCGRQHLLTAKHHLFALLMEA